MMFGTVKTVAVALSEGHHNTALPLPVQARVDNRREYPTSL